MSCVPPDKQDYIQVFVLWQVVWVDLGSPVDGHLVIEQIRTESSFLMTGTISAAQSEISTCLVTPSHSSRSNLASTCAHRAYSQLYIGWVPLEYQCESRHAAVLKTVPSSYPNNVVLGRTVNLMQLSPVDLVLCQPVPSIQFLS